MIDIVQLHGCKNVNTQINRRSGNDRRTATRTNVSFPLRDSQGITVTLDRRASCDRRTDGLELTELNLSQKVFQEAFKKFKKLERRSVQRRNIQIHFIKSVFALGVLCMSSFSYASENEGTIPRIITAPAEPLALEVVLLCPEGSQHEGELVPNWVTNDEATDYFATTPQNKWKLANNI